MRQRLAPARSGTFRGQAIVVWIGFDKLDGSGTVLHLEYPEPANIGPAVLVLASLPAIGNLVPMFSRNRR
jgi:hypothetical protein